ncbi:receptor-like protein 43 isoform X2 [Rhododendron vialii]|uniref:receptor-like protein 43 isoform X2 n=1 Tax=Rhododendron vialii TaxID=182163 RepID=UPI00265DEDBF|nr:receptor-like protein 43 isoform X2 [Rhododendron vialii]
MDSCLYLRIYLILCCFNLIILTYSSSSTQPLCHENESKALLQFKHNFFIDKFASVGPSAYPKLESWKLLGGKSDGCCSWDGVECDQDTSHVIGLDLSSSFLHGSINSNSSLFTLVHLRTLNLADNKFNFSEIPSRIGNLSRLTSLNLSKSGFFGQIPSEISSLSKLVILDLTSEIDLYSESLLKLEKPSLRDLVQNLTNLKVLNLSMVNISSSVPSVLSNISSLTTLNLEGCSLYGEFPMDIFRLPQLQILNVAWNENLTGSLPEFQSNSRLKAMIFHCTGLYGKLPDSIGRLESLVYLDLIKTSLSGTLPSPLGNLTRLSFLYLYDCKFSGQVPSSLANLSELTKFGIGHNDFDAGPLPLPPGKLLKLNHLYASKMNLQGNLPKEYIRNWNGMKMINKENLTYMRSNPEFEIELRAGPTTHLTVSYSDVWSSYYSMRVVSKGTHRLYERIQSALVVVDLSNNTFIGDIPESFGSLRGLQLLNISNNKLTSAIPTSLANLTALESLDLSQNLLSGHIPWQLTQLTFLSFLNVSHNRLTGPIPQGKQFGTFENSSYDGNLGLCGVPLSKSCRNSMTSPPPPPIFRGHDLEFSSGIYWMVIALGYGSGLVVGLAIGRTLTRRYHEWFVDTFGRGKKFQKKQKSKGRRT